MATLSLTKLAVATGGLALSLSAATGLASADPGTIVNTTCNYSQVIAALNDQNPAFAAQFTSSPQATGSLRTFLAAPPAQRQRMYDQLQNNPQAQPYLGTIQAVADTCNNY